MLGRARPETMGYEDAKLFSQRYAHLGRWEKRQQCGPNHTAVATFRTKCVAGPIIRQAAIPLRMFAGSALLRGRRLERPGKQRNRQSGQQWRRGHDHENVGRNPGQGQHQANQQRTAHLTEAADSHAPADAG